MPLNPEYLKNLVVASEKAAYGAFLHLGKGDKIIADQAAVDQMRMELNKIKMDGTVVIGEGEMDEAPMLYIGEKVGTKEGQKIDIALDPLEGTNFVAKNLPNACSCIAIAEKGNLLAAPDTYMEKIAIGSNLPKNLVDLDNSVEKNLSLLAEAKKINIDQLTACILDRPRHKNIIESCQKMNVNIKFIPDGDVYGVISVIDNSTGVDIYLGTGGGPEGVLAAAALTCFSGQMQTRLILDENEKKRASNLGIKDFDKKYNIEEMIRGDVMFCATGITDGYIVDGIKDMKESFQATTFALHRNTGFNKKIVNIHKK